MAEKEKAAKKQGKKKKSKQALFEVSGETVKRKNRYCPKCGPGIFMAAHKDRFACGKCGYTEWKK
ncbi:MAG: 30S ribosomal protein S27ae [Candidatus ainarchaeum sp.]|nr:30S ribosomal protein S27ae [Candidatus ainarchaeum sp.]